MAGDNFDSASGVKLDRELPPLIRSLKDGWASALQSSATVSALFAGVSSQLYSFFTNTSGNDSSYTRRNSPPGAITFMILLSYAAMLFNSGAAISSFILVDSLSELPYQTATFDDDCPYTDKSRVHARPSYLLRKYGIGIKWDLALWHWLFCYFAGIWCLILQIVTYVIMQEPDVVRLPITCVTIFIILPLIMYAVPQNILQKLGGAQANRVRHRAPNGGNQNADTGSTYNRVPQEEDHNSPVVTKRE